MRYSQIRKMDISNGPGIRVSLFTSGCPFHCKGCFNSETWPMDSGKEFTEKEYNLLMKLASKPHVVGLSILGGEPLIEQNLEELKALCKDLKTQFPNKTIWLWTGFTFEELNGKQKEALQDIDIIVDGRWIQDLRDFNLKYRGSSNQRVLDVQKSLAKNKPVNSVYF